MKRRAAIAESYGDFIIRKDNVEYALPTGWAIDGSGTFTLNNKLQDRSFSHGSDMVGDGKVKGRELTISFLMKGTTEADHDALVNRAYTYFSQTDYDLYCGRPDRLYHVAGMSKFKHSFKDGFKQRWSEVKVTLLLADPFRYEGRESHVVYEFTDDAAEAELVVQNNGSVETPVTFLFTPASKMASIVVYHKEAQEKMTLSDALLISPSVMRVNTKDGTVWRDSNNAINTFSGQFLNAKPGTNHFYYTGGAGTVEILYTNRWFV